MNIVIRHWSWFFIPTKSVTLVRILTKCPGYSPDRQFSDCKLSRERGSYLLRIIIENNDGACSGAGAKWVDKCNCIFSSQHSNFVGIRSLSSHGYGWWDDVTFRFNTAGRSFGWYWPWYSKDSHHHSWPLVCGSQLIVYSKNSDVLVPSAACQQVPLCDCLCAHGASFGANSPPYSASGWGWCGPCHLGRHDELYEWNSSWPTRITGPTFPTAALKETMWVYKTAKGPLFHL